MGEVLFRKLRPYIATEQHGFFPGRSTSTNLLEFTSLCMTGMDGGAQIDTVYTDLKAAFDRIDHRILLAKLDRLGVSYDIVLWLQSYLCNRKLSVKIGDTESFMFCNTSGVPQGSNLGPLLFAIFFNDVCCLLPQGCKLVYADDLKLYLHIRSTGDCLELQRLIDLFTEWCNRNLLIVSVSKCYVISFSRKKNDIEYPYCIDNQLLTRVSEIKDLGVILDKKLTFHSHYLQTIAKANKNLGFIMRVGYEFRDPYCLRALYYSLVRSVLDSNSIVWSPHSSNWITRIESIQSKFVRFALRFLPWANRYELPPYEDRCQLLRMEPLYIRRNHQKALFVAKLLTSKIDSPKILGTIGFMPSKDR